MKDKRHTLLVIAGFAIFLSGGIFTMVGGALLSPAEMRSNYVKPTSPSPSVRVTRGYVGLIEFRIIEDAHGNFDAAVGIRNPFN